MTSALAAFGTLLKMGNGVTTTAETFTTIAEVKDISGPSLSLNTVDVTAHDGSGWRDFVATLLDGGEVTFEVNYVPTNATHNNTAGLIKMMTGRTLRNYQLVFPGPTTWTFPAYVTGFEPAAPVDGALTASVTMKISGQPTLV
jgi:predicted secreted protein